MIKINLLPVREERRRMGARQEQTMFLGVIVLCLCGVLYWHMNTEKRLKAAREELTQLDAEIKRLSAIVADVDKFKAAKKTLEEKIGVIDKLKKNRQAQVHYMDEVSRALQPQVWLDFYQQQGDGLVLRGRALATDDIANFMRRLEASDWLVDVQLDQTSQKQEKLGDRTIKVNDFSLRMKVTAGPAGA